MKYGTVFFDLDGTLTDSAPGILNSIRHALKKSGIPEPDAVTLRKFIGPPLDDSYMRFCGMTAKQAMLGIDYFREYFNVKGMYENSVYDGVPEMLDRLKASGRRLVVATSKPEEFAKKILAHFGLIDRFDMVAGALMDETRTKKAAVIGYAMEELGIVDASSVVMVGDREHDIIGAREMGMDAIGVLYGYGDRDELEGVNPIYIAATPREVAEVIIN